MATPVFISFSSSASSTPITIQPTIGLSPIGRSLRPDCGRLPSGLRSTLTAISLAIVAGGGASKWIFDWHWPQSGRQPTVVWPKAALERTEVDWRLNCKRHRLKFHLLATPVTTLVSENLIDSGQNPGKIRSDSESCPSSNCGRNSAQFWPPTSQVPAPKIRPVFDRNLVRIRL